MAASLGLDIVPGIGGARPGVIRVGSLRGGRLFAPTPKAASLSVKAMPILEHTLGVMRQVEPLDGLMAESSLSVKSLGFLGGRARSQKVAPKKASGLPG